VCEAPAAPRTENRAFPFCSERCQTIDLGHWLDERYRVPSADTPDEDGTGNGPGNGDSS
jgi:endogenous inhibitor of DNA gyrase (YacG/DUF329 family)